MRRSNRLVGLVGMALFAGAVTVGHVPSASAQGAGKPAMTDKQKKDKAKAAYLQANKDFKAGKYAEALPNFQTADELYPGAAPKYKIAECYDKLGKTKEAAAAYKTFIDSNPGEKYEEKLATAQKRIDELEAALPAKVTIKVSPADVAGVAIKVDGQPAEGTDLTLDGGEHTIEIMADGYQPITEQVTVKPNSERELAVTLVPVTTTPAPTPPPDPEPVPTEEEEGPSNIPAYVTLGIAGAGVVLGAVFGAQALSAKSDFDEDPTVDNADAAERNALIADMSFGVALTFGITGAVLLISNLASDDEGGDEGAETASALPEITPYGGTKGGGAAATWKF